MPQFKLDFTINLGHVLTFGGLLVTMVLGWANFDTRLKLVEETLRTSTATMVQQVQLSGELRTLGGELRALDARITRIERIVDGRAP